MQDERQKQMQIWHDMNSHVRQHVRKGVEKSYAFPMWYGRQEGDTLAFPCISIADAKLVPHANLVCDRDDKMLENRRNHQADEGNELVRVKTSKIEKDRSPC